jgi:hypothetical protein
MTTEPMYPTQGEEPPDLPHQVEALAYQTEQKILSAAHDLKCEGNYLLDLVTCRLLISLLARSGHPQKLRVAEKGGETP